MFSSAPIVLSTFCLLSALATPATLAQSNLSTFSEHEDHVRGVVINSLTHEPISRALVLTGDNLHATFTDNRGHFEFIIPRPVAESAPGTIGAAQPVNPPSQPLALQVRKPGFKMQNRYPYGDSFVFPPGTNLTDLTLAIYPEARIIGRINLPDPDGSERVQLELYARTQNGGIEAWIPRGNITARRDGEFRFVDLEPGTYKLLTLEMRDSDPLTTDPHGQAYGYPPVYFPSAPDFEHAAAIELVAGQTFQPSITLVKKEYYPIRIGVLNVSQASGIGVLVSPQGKPAPGYSLGFNPETNSIEGMLPNGSYIATLREGQNTAVGIANITVSGGEVSGPTITMLPTPSITVNIRSELHNPHEPVLSPPASDNGPNRIVYFPNPQLSRPNQIVQVVLAPDEQFSQAGGATSQPSRDRDDSLLIEHVMPGRYRVSVTSPTAYAETVYCGGLDLLQRRLLVGAGSVSPIEITMRDDGAVVEGTVEPAPTSQINPGGNQSNQMSFVYLVPLDRIGDTSKQAFVPSGNTFSVPQLAPGNYRALAFDRPHEELMYPNEDALKRYESRSQLIHLVADQQLHLKLQLIESNE